MTAPSKHPNRRGHFLIVGAFAALALVLVAAAWVVGRDDDMLRADAPPDAALAVADSPASGDTSAAIELPAADPSAVTESSEGADAAVATEVAAATSGAESASDGDPASVAPEEEPAGESDTSYPGVVVSNDDEPAEVGAAAATADPEGDITESAVPESLAVVRDGKIYLEGAVPTEESAAAIVAIAGAVLGPDNVINEYVVDPRASDPGEGNVRVDDPVLFLYGSAVIAPEFEPLLGQALALMSLRPSVTLTIVGHTDSDGSEEFNLALSQERSDAVVQWLVERGVDPVRLSTIAKGESEPIATNDTEEGRQANRRIQVFIENLLADE